MSQLSEAKATNWCSITASWVGDRGSEGFLNPNYGVDFNLDVGRVTYYVYYRDRYLRSRQVSARDYNPDTNTTLFGVSTFWATRNPGWSDNTDDWRIDYSC